VLLLLIGVSPPLSTGRGSGRPAPTAVHPAEALGRQIRRFGTGGKVHRCCALAWSPTLRAKEGSAIGSRQRAGAAMPWLGRVVIRSLAGAALALGAPTGTASSLQAA
jgi:hypothetical protein